MRKLKHICFRNLLVADNVSIILKSPTIAVDSCENREPNHDFNTKWFINTSIHS